jgi:hypothetical protein
MHNDTYLICVTSACAALYIEELALHVVEELALHVHLCMLKS